MKKFLIILFIVSQTGILLAQSGSYPGSFARLGLGARGLGKGNAMVSDIYGENSGYYNPALSVFQEQSFASLGYTFLSMDRKLNFFSFAKRFDLQGESKQSAGISVSWINSGVTNIDGRDNDGNPLGDLSTFENQFYLGTSFLLDPSLAVGVGFKLYYSKLYDQLTTTSVAFDLGAIYSLNKDISFGLAVRDLGAKYKWETNKIYGSNGRTTENKFPVLVNLGASYRLPKNLGVASLEFESMLTPKYEDNSNGVSISPKNFYYLKAGVEFQLTPEIFLRGGCDRIGLNEDDFMGSLKPGFGLGFRKSFFKNTLLGVDYSFQYEPYSKDPIHNIGVIFKFK